MSSEQAVIPSVARDLAPEIRLHCGVPQWTQDSGARSLVASLLAMLGLYAVVSYLVTERRREIGIRLALGARVAEVGRLVQSQSARLALLGLLLGGVGALVLTRLLSVEALRA